MRALAATGAPSSPWRLALPGFVLALAGVLVLYRATFLAMAGIWERSDTFAHAFLVPPLVLWLAWRRRTDLATLVPQPLPWVLVPVALAALTWLLGDMAGVNALTQFAATALLALTVPATLGRAVARQLAFPLAFLFFMVPVGEFMMPQLMQWTADVTVFLVKLLGVPVYREGLQFVIPTGTWSVIEACSGVRYLIASFMVGTLFAYLNYRSVWRRVAFAIVSLVVPVVANWLRATLIVMLGHLSGNQLATGVDHLIYGWIFFGVVVMLMFMIGARWSQAPAAVELPTQWAAPDAAPGAAVLHWVVAAVLVGVAAVPQALAWQLVRANAVPPLLALPALGGLAPSPQALPHQPSFEGSPAIATAMYGAGDGAVGVHVAYYRGQTYGNKLVSSENMLQKSTDHRWRRVAEDRRLVRAGAAELRLRAAELRAGAVGSADAGPTLHVRQILWSGGVLTDSDSEAILRGVAGQLAGHGDDAAAITFYLSGPDDDATRRALDDFVARHIDSIVTALEATRTRR